MQDTADQSWVIGLAVQLLAPLPGQGLSLQEVVQFFISLEQNPRLHVLVQAVPPQLGSAQNPTNLSDRGLVSSVIHAACGTMTEPCQRTNSLADQCR